MTVIYSHQNERKGKNMSVLFSKVTLETEAGATRQFLCTGAPKRKTDLYGWTAYEDFIKENPGSEITAKVENYTYGDGEVYIANIYEVASYTQRGERFFRNPNVKRVGTAEFRC